MNSVISSRLNLTLSIRQQNVIDIKLKQARMRIKDILQ